jgi:glutathione peroxidase
MQPKFMHFTMVLLGSILAGLPFATVMGAEKAPGGFYDFVMKNIDGRNVPLSMYKGKVVLVVNVASECGYTPQYKGLEALFRKYKNRGFVIIGFPANNFGHQEPGTDAEIKTFCTKTYDVTFDLFSKISVKGSDQHPLYRFLTSAETNPEFSGDVKWNFQKYLLDRNGKIVGKFLSAVDPSSSELTSAIEQALNAH